MSLTDGRQTRKPKRNSSENPTNGDDTHNTNNDSKIREVFLLAPNTKMIDQTYAMSVEIKVGMEIKTIGPLRGMSFMIGVCS